MNNETENTAPATEAAAPAQAQQPATGGRGPRGPRRDGQNGRGPRGPRRDGRRGPQAEEVVFDRGGFKFCGKVKALADAARETGLKF